MKSFLELSKESKEPKQEVSEQIGGVLGGIKQAVAGAVGAAKGVIGSFTGKEVSPAIAKVNAVEKVASQQLNAAITKFATTLFKSMNLDAKVMNVLNASLLKSKKLGTGYLNSKHMVVHFIMTEVYEALKRLAPRETVAAAKFIFPDTQNLDRAATAKQADVTAPDAIPPELQATAGGAGATATPGATPAAPVK